MDPKQDQALKRLLKKLSALRATLKSDERTLLDGLITGAADEVGAHSMNVKAINTAKNLAKHASPDEAKALSMDNQPAIVSVRVIYDPTQDEYRTV